MDIFDILKIMIKRKIELVQDGIDEKDALSRAEFDISNEYHISLFDIKKLYGNRPS